MRSARLVGSFAAWVLLAACAAPPVPDVSSVAEAAPLLEAGRVDRETFTAIYAAVARHSLPEAVVEVDGPLTLTVATGAGTSSVSLDNFWSSYERDPGSARVRLEDFARFLVDRHRDLGSLGEVDLELVVPVVRDAGYVETMIAQTGGKLHPASEPLNEELRVLFAEDSPTGIRYLEWEDLTGGPPRGEALMAKAIENLERLLPEVQLVGESPVFMITAGGNYESSLLLLDDLWADYQDLVEGELVVAVPTRDVLVFTGSRSEEGLATLREGVENVFGGPYSISSSLYVRRGSSWEPWDGG